MQITRVACRISEKDAGLLDALCSMFCQGHMIRRAFGLGSAGSHNHAQSLVLHASHTSIPIFQIDVNEVQFGSAEYVSKC